MTYFAWLPNSKQRTKLEQGSRATLLRPGPHALLALFAFLCLTGYNASAANPPGDSTSGTLSPTSTVTPTSPSLLFDGEKAMVLLRKQVEYGPRIPDHEGLTKTRELIEQQLKQNGFQTERQVFVAPSMLLGRDVEGINLIGLRPGSDGTIRTILSCHYCTRPLADQDPVVSNRLLPVPGANDGASGVAVLLELARVIHTQPVDEGIALVFFDMEDHGDANNADGFALGSRHMAQNLPASLSGFRRGINIDMIGDKQLRLPMEGHSARKARNLTRHVWNVGHSMYPEIFVKEMGLPITDDHLPFLESGHQYINLIDFDYKPWHTLNDVPSNCSASSLEAVGKVLEAVLRH